MHPELSSISMETFREIAPYDRERGRTLRRRPAQHAREKCANNRFVYLLRVSKVINIYEHAGGARGIGFGITKAIGQMGGNVVCLDSLPEPVEEFKSLPDQYKIETHYFQTDVTKEQSLKQSFRDAVNAVGDLHGCVTAAGIALDKPFQKPFQEHTWEESRRILDVNCIGTFFSTQLAAKQMEKQGAGGSIITIASIAAQGKAWSVALPTEIQCKMGY